ncbi:phage baseplate protein [Aeromonas hydrophila]|uniref:phage baseplate protein n=1 Tax=Aeromonas hydrophila TaxID=644 RepID=UPI00140FB6DB|nr:phage baseplate protein [Aeromonas hydrophila]NHT35797.1 phage baseplate protein [Aeromonas hydrophila]
MLGMDRRTGRFISGTEQLASRLLQVFTTQNSSRTRRRLFGSNVPDALARLTNQALVLQVKAEMFDAMLNPANGVLDFKPTRIQFEVVNDGLHAHIDGRWRGSDITVRVPLYDQ